MAYRLIALDMDGTLLGQNKTISAQNEKWVKAAAQAGVKVTFATGRPIGDVIGYARQLGIDSPLVINNGSEVWRSPDVLHSRRELAPELVEGLFEAIREYGEEELDYWAHSVEGKIDKSNAPADPAAVRWLQFAIRSRNGELLGRLRDRLAAWNAFEISNSHPSNIEFNAIGVTKASGLLEVCSLLGIEMSRVMAIGDSLNDIPMIRAAGLGVAMGNAQEPVKRAADVVAPSVHEDGVAAMVERFIFS